MTVKECQVMLEKGVSAEVIHQIHGKLIQCTICFDEVLKRQLSYLHEYTFTNTKL